MLKLLIFIALFSLIVASVELLDDQLWANYKRDYGKVYESPIEESLRREIFSKNKEYIDKFNADSSNSFKLGINHLADRTKSELAALNGLKISEIRENTVKAQKFLEEILDSDDPLPDVVDWRTTGRVTDVKNQGNCGSCWAFAVTGVLEGQETVRLSSGDKELVPLSEQNLVDCATGNKGCDGGDIGPTLDFIAKEKGIDDEKSYPYAGVNQKCRFNVSNVAMTDSGSVVLKQGDEAALKRVVAKFGPVAVGIDASFAFMFYIGGIINDPSCSSGVDTLNHAVLIIGYGTENGKDFWLVKNSWSDGWGEQGYFRMLRNVNMCGIADCPTIPTFTS